MKFIKVQKGDEMICLNIDAIRYFKATPEPGESIIYIVGEEKGIYLRESYEDVLRKISFVTGQVL